MKKLLTGVLAMFMGLTVAMAQTPATTTQKEAKTKAKTEQKAVKKEAEKKEAAAAAPVAKTEHVTKAGAPDKRFKENKGATTTPATAGPKKKDGTPDMRYKSNNPNAGKKKS